MMENEAAVGANDKKPSQITTLTEISETLSPKPKSRSSSCFIVEQEARPTTEDERFQFDARKLVRKILSMDPTNLPTMTATEQEDFDNVLAIQWKLFSYPAGKLGNHVNQAYNVRTARHIAELGFKVEGQVVNWSEVAELPFLLGFRMKDFQGQRMLEKRVGGHTEAWSWDPPMQRLSSLQKTTMGKATKVTQPAPITITDQAAQLKGSKKIAMTTFSKQ